MAKTYVEISKSSLLHNIRAVKRHVAPAAVMAVVKSNAYGHGMSLVAKAVAKDTDWFGVDDVDEALELRRLGLKHPILVLGYTRLDRLKDCARHRVSFVAYNVEALKTLKRLGGKPGSFRVHIPIETGTTRQGIASDELEAFVTLAKTIPSVTIEGVHTHFANIEDTTDPTYAKSQLKKYEHAILRLKRMNVVPAIKHTAASAAGIIYPETRFDIVRLGIALYGHWPSKETIVSASYRSKTFALKPSLAWKTIVAQVKDVQKGTPVSYGLTERVSRDAKIAVIPVGYWDGYDRGLSSVGQVLIRGHRCKVMGRVCMNMMMVDVTDVPGVQPEDDVVLIGTQGRETVTAEDVASKCGTIQYEFLTRINPQIERTLVV